MTVPNLFKTPPFASKGDADADSLHLAVGRALSAWEHAESRFAHLFEKHSVNRVIRRMCVLRPAFCAST